MISRDQILKSSKQISNYGMALGDFMPWHRSSDPFIWLIAEILLRRTSRVAAERAFDFLMEKCQNWKSIRDIPESDLIQILNSLGFVKQRTKQIKDLSRYMSEKHRDTVPCNKEKLLKLPGVGPYAADAVLLHACGQKFLPVDGNIQRVFRRIAGLPIPRGNKELRGTRRLNFNRDLWLQSTVEYLVQTLRHRTLINLHNGVLSVGWSFCRSKPMCPRCPINKNCMYAKD